MNRPLIAHFELCNWSRFCWEGAYPHPFPPNHCYSFEHNYLAPSDMSNDDAPEPRIQANAKNAMIVHRIYVALPITQRLVLCAEYPKRHESGRVAYGVIGAARKLKISMSEYEHALSVAFTKVMEAFD